MPLRQHSDDEICLIQQLLRQSDTISELRTEIKNLQADNLKLYEKVRYLESYSAGSGTGAPSSLRSLVGTSKRDEELGKYRSLYEDSMNPFEAFKSRVRPAYLPSDFVCCLKIMILTQEHGRAVSNLNPIEKMLFTLSTFILGNRYMRNLFVAYALCLHIFVFSTLWGS